MPIIRDVHTEGLSRISRERAGLAKRGAAGQLAPEELADSVFPLSNSWVLDSLLFTPITKPPHRAPLATGQSPTGRLSVGERLPTGRSRSRGAG